MTDYKPGTVAIATVCGVRDMRVFRTGIGWHTGNLTHSDAEVTDVRPLVVLDLAGCGNVATQLRYIADQRTVNADRSLLLRLADQIEEQTKPPRIPEPGLWGVVNASTTNGIGLRNWARLEHGWVSSDGIHHVAWNHLVDPTLIREGMQA